MFLCLAFVGVINLYYFNFFVKKRGDPGTTHPIGDMNEQSLRR
jgi:hypothetical protein